MKTAIFLALAALFVAAHGWDAYDTNLYSVMRTECPEIPECSGECKSTVGRFKIFMPGNCGYKNKQITKFVYDKCIDGKPTNDGASTFAVNNVGECCDLCKTYKGTSQFPTCLEWQYVRRNSSSTWGVCVIYTKEKLKCHNGVNLYELTQVGSNCAVKASPPPPPAVNVSHDPHLVGAHGTHYDFSGLPDKSFCLVTDQQLYVNMKLSGYLDERTESATKFVNGKAVRTWIREVGIVWTLNGKEHKLKMVAREGKETSRGPMGFLASAELDSEVLPHMQVGDKLNLAGGLILSFRAQETSGPYDVDFYTLSIENLIDMDVRMRVANPHLRTESEAFAHFSLGVNNIKMTPMIHGVLGQTYRDGREERSSSFQQLVSSLHHAVGADSEIGSGFLDGNPGDYLSSDVLSTDCNYSGYGGKNMPTLVSSE